MNEELINKVKEILINLTPEERLKCFEDYCMYCGDEIPLYGCHCMNDE